MATKPGPIRVLHVDDEPDFAEMAAEFIEREGDDISVETVTSVDAALDHLPGGFDCIVSDHDMPGRTGVEFLQQVRSEYPDLPFILFTGKGSEEVASEAISAGVSDYLQKGTGTERYSLLANRIENLVTQYRAASELETRAQQQRLVAELGQQALVADDPQQLFEEAVSIVSDTLGNEYAKVLELYPDDEELLLRAGVGWQDGLVGTATVGTGEDSQAGHTLRSEEPIVVTNLQTETRFRGSRLLTEHDITSGISVVIGSKDDPWGVLGTHSTEERSFSDDDVTFVQNVSNVLANAIERHHAEEELRESEQRFRKMTELSPDTVFRLDKAGVIRYISPAVEELLGYPTAEMVSTSFDQYLTDDSLPAAFDGVKRTFDGEVVRDLELTLVDADGEEIDIEVSASPVRDEGTGDVVRIQGIVRDISDRKTREQQLHALQDRTQELMHTTSIEETGRLAVETAQEILGTPLAGFHVLDEAEQRLEPVEFLDTVRDELGGAPTYVRSADSDPASRVVWSAFEAGEPLEIDDVREYEDLVEITPARTIIIHPLSDLGVFITSATEPNAFDATDKAYIDILATALASALERVERETQLTTERDRFKTLFEHLSVPVVEVTYPDDTPNPIVRAVNPAFEERFGYSQPEIADQPLDEFIVPPEDRSEATALNERALKGESVYGIEVVRETADGLRTFLLHSAVYPHQPGGFAIYTDITARKEHERALETLHDIAAELVSADSKAQVADQVVEAANSILDFPIAMVRYYDEASNGLVPAAASEETNEVFEDRPVFTPTSGSLNWEVYKGGQRRLFENIHEDHQALDADTDLRTLMLLPLGEHGTLSAGSTIANAFDDGDVFLAELLTTTARAVLDRLEQEEELRHERNQFRSLFELIPDPVTHVRFDGDEPVLRDVNPAFEATFGYDAEQAIGESVNDLIVPPDRRREGERIDDRIQTKGTIDIGVRRETADGIGDFLFRTVPIDNTGSGEEYFGIYVDITDQKESERRLERANERLDEFASVLSHDLRNPLSVASGRLELARQEYDSEDLEQVERALERMDALIESLHTLARDGSEVTELEAFNLDEIAEACWKNVETADASLDIDTSATIEGDRSQVRQLIENAFRNAVEHGGASVEVTLGDLSDGFYIEDDGPGFPEDSLGELFETGSTTNVSGPGLGLSIVKRVADAHGWTITLTDSATGGARLEITWTDSNSSQTGGS